MTRPIPACGTTGGYARHQRLNETPCDECRFARAEWQRFYRAGGKKPRKVAACGTIAGYKRHHANGDEPCEPCREANRERQRDAKERAEAHSAPPFDHPDAACKGADTALFYPDKGDHRTVAQAIAVCDTCPAKEPCLAHAIEHREQGIWGGTTPRQRSRMRKGQPPGTGQPGRPSTAERILATLRAARRPMTSLEVADATGVQPATASRALLRLAQAGHVTPDGHGHYQLTKENAT